jgi:hypothetical protein
MAKIRKQVTDLLSVIGSDVSSENVANSLDREKLNGALAKIIAFQTVKIKGMGTQQFITQDIAINLIVNTIMTPTLQSAIDKYAGSKKVIKGETPSDIVGAMYSNVFTEASNTCLTTVSATQASTITCDSEDMQKLTVEMRKSPECSRAMESGDISQIDIACNACSLSHIAQKALVSLQSDCIVPNKIVEVGREKLNELISSYVADRATTPEAQAIYDNSVRIVNDFNQDLVSKIVHSIDIAQTVMISNPLTGEHKTAISQNTLVQLVMKSTDLSYLNVPKTTTEFAPTPSFFEAYRYYIIGIIICIILIIMKKYKILLFS